MSSKASNKYFNVIIFWIYNKIKQLIIYSIKRPELVVSILAVCIAIESMKNANVQFKQNRIDSNSTFELQQKQIDSLFNQQIERNDILIKQIVKLQEITDNQLQNSKSQLNISKQMLEENLLAGFPYFQIYNISLSDIIIKEDSTIYSPKITILLRNSGERFASNFKYSIFVVYDNFKTLHVGNDSGIDNVAPKSIQPLIFTPNIKIDFKDDYYLCFEISYYDERMNKPHKQVYYYHSLILRGEFNFQSTSPEERKKLKDKIDSYLAKNKLPLFASQYKIH